MSSSASSSKNNNNGKNTIPKPKSLLSSSTLSRPSSLLNSSRGSSAGDRSSSTLPSLNTTTTSAIPLESMIDSSLLSHDTYSSSAKSSPLPLPRAPTSLLAGALPTSLLQDGNDTMNISMDSSVNDSLPSATPTSTINNSAIPSRPRRLWTIQDTSLKSIPRNYPPLNRYCTTYVGDASPSVVAVRLSECFRKRSIAVEYDDETITANAMTVDRCWFTVQLWKGKVTKEVDFSQGVVVEITRTSGSTISFHAHCRALLQAALGQSTGLDERLDYQKANGMEFDSVPLQNSSGSNKRPKRLSSSYQTLQDSNAAQAYLEQAYDLFKKDRLDTQLLGMERLVHLTTPRIVGDSLALQVSNMLLSIPTNDNSLTTDSNAASSPSSWFAPLVVLPEFSNKDEHRSSASSLLQACSTSHHHSNKQKETDHSNSASSGTIVDEWRHETRMRAYALRVLSNALSVTASHKTLAISAKKSETDTSSNPHWLWERPLLDSLVVHMKGANRPSSVVEQSSQRLASVHESALAIQCCRILAEHSPKLADMLQSNPTTVERLEFTRMCGRATHMILQQESEQTYSKLTEDVRSC